MENLEQKSEIQVTYFQPDEKKDGGTYMTFRGHVKKISAYDHRIIFMDGTSLPIDRLFAITGELFREMEI